MKPATAADVAVSRRAVIEAVIASTVGTTVEWYDFFLCGAMAALVFPALFFPASIRFRARSCRILSFTAGFAARPLGDAFGKGNFFGVFGNKSARWFSRPAEELLRAHITGKK
jgi:hypothetical protein